MLYVPERLQLKNSAVGGIGNTYMTEDDASTKLVS